MTGATAVVQTARRLADRDGVILLVARAAWLGVFALACGVAWAAFAVYLQGDRGLVVSQGPLALQPALARELELRLFDASVLKAGQLVIHIGGSLLFAATALLLFVRRSRDLVIILSSGMLVALGSALFVPSSLLPPQSGWRRPAEFLGVFDAGPEFWTSVAGVSVILFAFVFPDGRFAADWTRKAATGVLTAVAAGWMFRDAAPFEVSTLSPVVAVTWTVGLALVVVVATVHRYLTSPDRPRRGQTRLVVVSVTAIVSTFLLIWALSPDLASNVDLGLVLVTGRLQAIYDLNLLALLTLSLLLLPVSIVVSVARHRLWDIDVIVNRALVYGLLTGVIAALLFGLVAVTGAVAGDRFGSGVGVGMTGALMAVIFHPLRTRIQTQVDRRFYRQKYDAERTIDLFSTQVRDLSELSKLEARLADVLDETLRPVTARLVVGRLEGDDKRALLTAFLADPTGPVQIPKGEAAAQGLEGVDLVVPLVSGEEVVGVLELGPRLGGLDYSGLDRSLLRRLAASAAPVVRYAQMADRQAREATVRERIEHELRLARAIQMDLLPRSLPQLDGWDVAAHYRPAREVGGDLYDFIDLDEGRWGLVLADVTDKGVPAAMVMASCRSMLRGVATGVDRPSPGQVLQRVNELLVPDTPPNMFVTCFYAVIDPATGTLSYANAGQDLPVLWSDRTREVRARGMPLGLMAGSEYEEGEVEIRPGESLLFFTDGLVEAHNDGGEMFGRPRLVEWLQGRLAGPRLIDELMEALAAFVTAGSEPEDDVTLVALRRCLPGDCPVSRSSNDRMANRTGEAGSMSPDVIRRSSVV